MGRKLRASFTGKIHIGISPRASICNAHNVGIYLPNMISLTDAMRVDNEMFCKKCFGKDPKKEISRLSEKGYFEE